MTDPLGRNLDGGANLAIAGVPVLLAATFTDPSRADTQTASVAWSDGTTDTAFKTFSDARNGAKGQLGDAYVYAASGTFEIVATITDDDKDPSSVSFTIQVLSIDQAITDVVEQIDALLSTATDPKVVAALLNARNELAGNHGARRRPTARSTCSTRTTRPERSPSWRQRSRCSRRRSRAVPATSRR